MHNMDRPLLDNDAQHAAALDVHPTSLLSHELSGNLTEGGDIDTENPSSTWHDAKHQPTTLTGWVPIAGILLADMFGLGALTLPSALARLGWAPGLGAIILAGVSMVYTGV